MVFEIHVYMYISSYNIIMCWKWICWFVLGLKLYIGKDLGLGVMYRCWWTGDND